MHACCDVIFEPPCVIFSHEYLLPSTMYLTLNPNLSLIHTSSSICSLNKKMRVDMNITFPALHCDDLHLDAMDVAGDSQLNIVDTLVKKRLHLDGTLLSDEEIRVEANKNAKKDSEDQKFKKDGKLPRLLRFVLRGRIQGGRLLQHVRRRH